jgi:hypothetical protein
MASLGILQGSYVFKYVQKQLQILQDTETGFNVHLFDTQAISMPHHRSTLKRKLTTKINDYNSM